MPESDIHADFKWSFYTSESDYVEIEKTIGRTRTDVLTQIDDRLVAIEIQRTRIPIASILRRMSYHTEIDAHTLWIISPDALIYHKGIRCLNWIMFIQRIQNGITFLPGRTDQTVVPCHIDNSILIARDGHIQAGRKWIDQQQETQISGLTFEKNLDFDLNVSSYADWWTDEYLTYLV